MILSHDRKLKYLKEYMNEWVELWPNKPPEFTAWMQSVCEKKISDGREKEKNKHQTICRYCNRGFIENYIIKTKDHIVPVSKGGLDSTENKTPCCYDCNQWKADKMPDRWLKEIKRILEKERNIFQPYDKKLLTFMVQNLNRVIEQINKNKRAVSIYNF